MQGFSCDGPDVREPHTPVSTRVNLQLSELRGGTALLSEGVPLSAHSPTRATGHGLGKRKVIVERGG